MKRGRQLAIGLAACAFVLAGCSLDTTTKLEPPHLALTAAGRARAQAVVLQREDFPSYYSVDGRTPVDGPNDCLNLGGLTVVGRARSPIFDVKDTPEIAPEASSHGWVLESESQARTGFGSTASGDFQHCLRDGFTRAFTSGGDKAEVSVDSIKLDLVSAEGSADDVRGYGATIALTSKDGTGTSASADVIVVRLGASIGFYVFVGIGPRNTGVDYSEQTAVVNTVGRVANSFLYRAEAKGLDPTFTVSKGQHRIGEAITFTARTAKQDGFAWNFGDGHMDDGLDKSRSTISHSYRKPGRYTVELAVGLGPSAESKTVLTVLRASHNTPSEKRRRRKPEREPHLPPVTERTSWILAPRPLRPR